MTLQPGLMGRPRGARAVLAVIAVIAVLLAAVHTAEAQRTTEQFIPIGQSPGLSGSATYSGEIISVDPVARRLTMRRSDDGGTVTVTVAGDTRIWLDRSLIGRPNLSGGITDIVPGSTAEIHYRDPERRRVAAWVKVRSERPD